MGRIPTKMGLGQKIRVKMVDGCWELQNFESKVLGIVLTDGLPAYVDVDAWKNGQENGDGVWVAILLPDGEMEYFPEETIILADYLEVDGK